MLAYHGKESIKTELVLRLKDDAKNDRLIHGHYWKNGKGCAVGCTIRGSEHAKYETLLGIPQSIAHLEDSIFEGLTNSAAQKFPLDFAAAITPGADLSKVTAKFIVWCLLDKKHGAIRQAPADKSKDCHDAILAAAAIWQDYIKTGVVDASAASAAYSAAVSAASAADSAAARAAYNAASAAYSAASTDSATSAASAASAARAAARAASAAYSTDSATRAAARAAYSADRLDFWKAAAATLLKLLRSAPVPQP